MVLAGAAMANQDGKEGNDAKESKESQDSKEARVHTAISVEHLEGLLKGMEIDFKKTELKSKREGHYFAFARGKFKLGLYDHGGRELMVVSDFKALPLEFLNQWNRGRKQTRAVLHQGGKREFASLEAVLDVAAGVTDDTVRHFLRRFEEELKQFDKLVHRSETREEEVYPSLPPEHLEKILKLQKIAFKRTAGKKAGNFIYAFARDSYKFRIYDFQGADLMIEATFSPAALEQVNRYNLTRKFVRAVLHQPAGGNAFTTLEANLDCTGGVSDSIVSYFLQTFLDETRQFDRFLSKLK
jgi:hypothetical protein